MFILFFTDDDNRVILNGDVHKTDNDYINASFIHVSSSQYILRNTYVHVLAMFLYNLV